MLCKRHFLCKSCLGAAWPPMPPLEEPKLDLDPLLDPLEVQLCRGYDDDEVDEDLAHELEEGRLEELEELEELRLKFGKLIA